MTPQTETWNKVNKKLQISVTKGGRHESPNAALLNCTGVWEGFWVGADVFCKLTAGCITVAVVGALAFLTMVISMGYGLLARDGIPRIEVQRFFWTNLWSNSSSKLQTSEDFGPYSTYHHALWYTEMPSFKSLLPHLTYIHSLKVPLDAELASAPTVVFVIYTK